MEIAFVWILVALVCSVVATAKGRSWFLWLLGGMIFGFFALVVVAVLPSRRPVLIGRYDGYALADDTSETTGEMLMNVGKNIFGIVLTFAFIALGFAVLLFMVAS